ncbi:MAG TPA: ribonuclease III [Gammaproteobacteria bacterium]|nr:ribonuclease III [Gammaproteobacteria bacterium]
MSGSLASLERALRYSFRDPGLLEQALTHRSAGSHNNERLEFLGDALLNLVIAEALFAAHEDVEEGGLSRLRASLVNQDALAVLAQDLQLGEHLRLGPGEMKSGGQRRASILADTLEAVLGAIHLDAGFEAVRTTVLSLFSEKLANPPALEDLKDAKTRLQEWLQARNMALPVYQVEAVSGEAHRQVFRVSCRIETSDLNTTGEAGSRRAAEQEAAGRALERLLRD